MLLGGRMLLILRCLSADFTRLGTKENYPSNVATEAISEPFRLAASKDRRESQTAQVDTHDFRAGLQIRSVAGRKHTIRSEPA
jgi:hypothetical protein